MLVKYTLSAAALLVLHGPLLAQQAELLHFDGPPGEVVIHVGNRPPPPGKAAPTDRVDLSSILASDFGLIGAPAVDDLMPPRPSIEVPQWMRAGARPPISASGFTFLPLTSSGCGSVEYRPRADLPASTELRRARLFPLIASVACEHQIPVGLFDSLIAQESRYDRNALSPKGAIGLAQLMPGTAQQLGVTNPWDTVQNLRGGARYLRQQINEFGRYDLALAAYNAGPGRVRPQRRIPRIRETLEYVRNITLAWTNHEKRYGSLTPGLQTRSALDAYRRAAVASYTSTSVANPR